MKDTQPAPHRPGRMVRWLYRSGRPNRPARAMNRIGAMIASAGLVAARYPTFRVIDAPAG